jgi:dienelactone hydrolase
MRPVSTKSVFALLALTYCTSVFGQPPAAAGPGTGAHPAILEGDPSLPTHAIYRPENLAPFGKNLKLPLVVWANGACYNYSTHYAPFLTEIASHGFLVIAIGPAAGGTGNDTKSSQLLDAIDWATAENQRAGSKYAGKVDIAKIAVMGHSCGGLEALEVAPDPRVTTAVIWSSGVLNDFTKGPAMPVHVTKDTLQQLHSPVAYFTGGTKDVAYPNATDDFARIHKIPAFLASLEVGHGGTYAQPNGGPFGVVGVAWLEWQLKGDKRAAKMFTGAACGLCTDSRWTVQQKLNPGL